MSLVPREKRHYHVFLASPGDVNNERQTVRSYFQRWNANIGQIFHVHFDVIDWENYATTGVGRPQALITQQTLETYKDSLALVIGIMGQRFGSPTGVAESGTEEEFEWAFAHNQEHGVPEIKWFFLKTGRLELDGDSPDDAERAVEQWKKVQAFRKRLQKAPRQIFYTEYPSPDAFRDVFEADLTRWLADSNRPWVVPQAAASPTLPALTPPQKYYENLERDFHRLDIAGIDNDRAFEIPLSEIYVRLRVMFDEDAVEETESREAGAIDIQTALRRYRKLVIVGDPGSGKSTFLKYIALMLARSVLRSDPSVALEKLFLPEPLPIPAFLSCWDLSDFLKRKTEVRLQSLLEFIADRLTAYGFNVSVTDVEELLAAGSCCLLFDGLDEVPTDAGRAAVSRLVEDCVQQYGNNRFVVTSRVRGYTGDAMLKGQFTRCDIQPFDAKDRSDFVANWVTLLFGVAPEEAHTKGTPAEREFTSLTEGVERNDRIRPLAVNPLLLTVIAIVHWNRKRLPEQRVDLYDECVDVLLGQRKDAEHVQLSRKVSALDEQRESDAYEERAMVRKRFAEIALHILCLDGDRDEASKEDVIRLLAPRFEHSGAVGTLGQSDHAITRAERFLEKQELRSGLLVSRRTHAYRFVHLTFQEFLAAWHLSNMDFEQAIPIVQPRLRVAKWFETLQLLGGEWAKQSDQKVERYVAWLLENRGSSIADQAPVVALCANILKDIRGVAEVTPATRRTFRKAVEGTLDAFRARSGVSTTTQLEILEALGQLGAAVKSHLIEATKAGVFPVRRRAIEMLLPHLSDDELFQLPHILDDRSREPIALYLTSLLERNARRACELLDNLKYVSPKCAHAVVRISFEQPDDIARPLLTSLAQKAESTASDLALTRLTTKWPDEETHRLLLKCAVCNGDYASRTRALTLLAGRTAWTDEALHELLLSRAATDPSSSTRIKALQLLASRPEWIDETTPSLLKERFLRETNYYSAQILTILATTDKLASEDTRRFIESIILDNPDSENRVAAIRALAGREDWADTRTRELLQTRCGADPSPDAKGAALEQLLRKDSWADDMARDMLLKHIELASLSPWLTRELLVQFSKRQEWRSDTRQMIENGASATVRGAAACVWFGLQQKDALADAKRRVFSRDLDGVSPFFDPRAPLPAGHLVRISNLTGLSAGQLSQLVHEMNAELGWDIRKGKPADA